MIHYHGTPLGGPRQDVARFLWGRHALVPFPRHEDIGIVAEACKSFVLDNGAYSIWRSGGTLDVSGYCSWVRDWCLHPGFHWALIPDVIEGDEQDNDALVTDFAQTDLRIYGVPVWHLHESIDRLELLCAEWPTVALGSSGQWATPGTAGWWDRMSNVMDSICDQHGRPPAKLHGLRMLDPEIFSRLPLASADSTNAAANSGATSRFGMYQPPTMAQRADVIAGRIESVNSAAVWLAHRTQIDFELAP